MIQISEKCVGCGACASVCPVSAIVMDFNKEGFLIPIVKGEKCIHCKKCIMVCEQYTLPQSFFIKSSFLLRHKDSAVWNASTSGGAFTILCEACKTDTYICGAVYNEQFKVEHIIARPGTDDYKKMRKSKYVQSDMSQIYSEVKKLLLGGNKVLFSGTPCQVCALRLFLGKEFTNLTCIDVACHGVGSPQIFEKYIKEREKETGKTLKRVSFRIKEESFGNLKDYGFLYEYTDGMKSVQYDDLYTNAFIQSLVCRKSCFECRFRGRERQGDITLADSKNVQETLPEIKNYSAIYINTEKGKKLYKKAVDISAKEIDLREISFELAAFQNPPLNKGIPHQGLKQRELFFEDYCKSDASVKELLKRYVDEPALILKMWLFVPISIRIKIKSVLRRIKRCI